MNQNIYFLLDLNIAVWLLLPPPFFVLKVRFA